MSSSRRTCGRPGCPRSGGSAVHGSSARGGAPSSTSRAPSTTWSRTPTANGATPGTTTTSSSTSRRSSSPSPRPSVTEDEKGDIVFDRTQMTMTATTYRRDAQGLLGPGRARQGPGPQLHRRLAALPDLPPFLRPDVLRGQGQGARPRLRQGEQRLDGRGMVRALGRLQHPALHHPPVGRRARRGRDEAQRRAWGPRHRVQRDPDPAQAPEHQQRVLGPAVAGLQRLRRDRLHARRLVVVEPGRLSGLAPGRRSDAGLQQRHRVPGGLALLGQPASASPSSSWPTRRARSAGSPTSSSAPTRSGRCTTRGRTPRIASRSRPRRSTTAASSAASRPTATVCGRSRRSGEDNICFETDYPHTDTTWPYSEAYIEKLCVGLTDEQAYKILRGNAIKMLELDRV